MNQWRLIEKSRISIRHEDEAVMLLETPSERKSVALFMFSIKFLNSIASSLENKSNSGIID